MGFRTRVQGLQGFDSEFRGQFSRFNETFSGGVAIRVPVYEDPEDGLGFRVQGFGFMVHGSGFRVQGSGFRV